MQMIDGYSLKLSVASVGIAHNNELNSIAWLFRDDSISKYQFRFRFTLGYITSTHSEYDLRVIWSHIIKVKNFVFDLIAFTSVPRDLGHEIFFNSWTIRDTTPIFLHVKIWNLRYF